MSEEELNESAQAGNSDESVSAEETDPSASNDATAGQSEFNVGDERFKDPQGLYKAYRDLEAKLGNHSELESRAKQWDSAVKALAADKDISEARAEELLTQESEELLGKNSEKIQQRQENSEIAELKLSIAKRDLIDEYPEAKDNLTKIMDLAKTTGKSPLSVYETYFQDMSQSQSQASSGQSYKPVRRNVDDDAPPSTARKERALEERIAKARSTSEMEELVREKMKLRKFGG